MDFYLSGPTPSPYLYIKGSMTRVRVYTWSRDHPALHPQQPYWQAMVWFLCFSNYGFFSCKTNLKESLVAPLKEKGNQAYVFFCLTCTQADVCTHNGASLACPTMVFGPQTATAVQNKRSAPLLVTSCSQSNTLDRHRGRSQAPSGWHTKGAFAKRSVLDYDPGQIT